MIKQLQQAITKLSELPEIEQEAIAQIIITTIESKKQSANAWDTLKEMAGSISDSILLSESSLAKDWLTEEEDKAWENL
jgi:hypothetical protein